MRHNPNGDFVRQRTATHRRQPAISIAVAIGVSGGKDSQAAAMATFDYLDRIGHCGPCFLIHADLGSVEWADSLPTCEQLSDRLAAELIVVRRKQGGLMDRRESRWRSNVARYENLSTVTLVPCWSTPTILAGARDPDDLTEGERL